jgi:glucosamine--fructose-6-phosphate aminotransferase (isomerizing)
VPEQANQFLAEVAEQPAALRNLLAYCRGAGRDVLLRWAAAAASAGRVTFAGMGTSEFAPEMVLAALADYGVDARTMDAGELLHYPRPVHGLLCLISQSGESVETKRLAARVESPSSLIALINNPDSSLARAASLVLEMRAGEESAVTTKTYVNTLAALHLMAQALRGPSAIARGLSRLEALAAALPEVDEPSIARAAALLSDAPALHVIARGPATAAARQIALTFMESCRLTTVAFTGGAFRHGPFETVGEGHHALLLIPGGATTRLVVAMAQEVAEKGSRVVAIADHEVALPAESVLLRVPDFGEALFCLAAATTQELLLNAIAERRGLVPGEFRYGEKVTSRE